MNNIRHLHGIGTLHPLQSLACRCQKCGVIGAIMLHRLCGRLLETFVLRPLVPKLPLQPRIIGQKRLLNSRERATHKPKSTDNLSRHFTWSSGHNLCGRRRRSGRAQWCRHPVRCLKSQSRHRMRDIGEVLVNRCTLRCRRCKPGSMAVQFFPRCRTQHCNAEEKDTSAGRSNAQVSGFLGSFSTSETWNENME